MRKAKITRGTKETQIELEINLDGKGIREIATGIGFFDHMLDLFAVHGGFDLKVKCKGDIDVDGHHTVEDIGIVLGQAIAKAVGDKNGIERYASFYLPMDEALTRTVLDISGRPYLAFDADLQGMAGGFDAQLTGEFFRAVCVNAGITCHIDVLRGSNLHHVIESIFKGFARALKSAVKITGKGVPSSKGVL
ncbi:MAG: imidazoleglycerol-phosphate dehydratase HisB [Firmicutes bacterium]|nr:imidazoleglycerol-phosphate dehydratase HisB [Bacillota bacterium]